MRKFIFLIFPILLLTQTACAFGQGIRSTSPSISKTITVGSLERSYRVFVPANLSKKFPLVFVFHGAGGNGTGLERFTKFSILAEREGFIAVYPDGIEKNWNDGRESQAIPAQKQNVDDIGFVKQGKRTKNVNKKQIV